MSAMPFMCHSLFSSVMLRHHPVEAEQLEDSRNEVECALLVPVRDFEELGEEFDSCSVQWFRLRRGCERIILAVFD
jgi:hypothetical protein